MSDTSTRPAEVELLRSRERLTHTFDELQRRLSPVNLAADLTESVRERAADATGRSIAAVKARPIAAAAVALPLLGFLFRRPLTNAINAVLHRDPDQFDSSDETPADAG